MNVDRALRLARKTLTTALVTLVTAAGVTAAAPSTATAATPAVSLVSTANVFPAYSDTYYEQGVQYWVNRVRKQHGLRPLSLATCTDRVAEAWTTHLAATSSFYHQSMTRLLNKCRAYYAGETLGKGAITPRTLVTMWMHSAPHRAVLMSRSPTRIGIGAMPTASGEWVVTANFMKL
jgi:uncharacterized protein YkwD